MTVHEYSTNKRMGAGGSSIRGDIRGWFLVERILSAKRADAGADTCALEREIDQMVYQLYGLTEEEIKIVEGETK